MKALFLFLVVMVSMEIPVAAGEMPSGKVQATDAKPINISGEASVHGGMSYSEVRGS